ncbi:hypothetical protein NDU88_008022 [Pleurodeles waltl]|uniref:Uncharacterized protein n=1 Tax=Pleurodeles waltl TaxID=8319 RepID=A0AAV7QRN1_PLEWA|nr:hypothetical protein NDU88_008022 [Pleurodeles waltl]
MMTLPTLIAVVVRIWHKVAWALDWKGKLKMESQLWDPKLLKGLCAIEGHNNRDQAQQLRQPVVLGWPKVQGNLWIRSGAIQRFTEKAMLPFTEVAIPRFGDIRFFITF